MATEAQISANRENAKKSTGPRSLRGKSRSALNALKHGFRSRIILEESKPFTDESPSPFADFLSDLVAEVQPVGVLESLCVETMAISLWRQRLVIRRELELVFEATPEKKAWRTIEEEMYQEDLEEGLNPPPLDLEAHFPNPEKLLPLMRYEAHLDRQFQRALRQLQQLQATRFGRDRRPFHFPSHPVPNEPNDDSDWSSAPVPPASTSSDPARPISPANDQHALPNEPNSLQTARHPSKPPLLADRRPLRCASNNIGLPSIDAELQLPNEPNFSSHLLSTPTRPPFPYRNWPAG